LREIVENFNKSPVRLEIIDYLRTFAHDYLADTLEGKVEFLRNMSYGVKTDGESVVIEWKKAFSFLLDSEVIAFLPPNTTDRKVFNPVMHASQDSNLRPTA